MKEHISAMIGVLEILLFLLEIYYSDSKKKPIFLDFA